MEFIVHWICHLHDIIFWIRAFQSGPHTTVTIRSKASTSSHHQPASSSGAGAANLFQQNRHQVRCSDSKNKSKILIIHILTNSCILFSNHTICLKMLASLESLLFFINSSCYAYVSNILYVCTNIHHIRSAPLRASAIHWTKCIAAVNSSLSTSFPCNLCNQSKCLLGEVARKLQTDYD